MNHEMTHEDRSQLPIFADEERIKTSLGVFDPIIQSGGSLGMGVNLRNGARFVQIAGGTLSGGYDKFGADAETVITDVANDIKHHQLSPEPEVLAGAPRPVSQLDYNLANDGRLDVCLDQSVERRGDGSDTIVARMSSGQRPDIQARYGQAPTVFAAVRLALEAAPEPLRRPPYMA